jgi:hypothetical protein
MFLILLNEVRMKTRKEVLVDVVKRSQHLIQILVGIRITLVFVYILSLLSDDEYFITSSPLMPNLTVISEPIN